MDGFEKIELQTASSQDQKTTLQETESPPSRTRLDGGKKSSFGRLQKLRSKRVYTSVGIVLVLFIFLVFIPGILTVLSAKNTYTQAKVTIAALKKQDIEAADKNLKKTRENLKDTQTKLNLLFVLKFIPGPNIYYNDATHLVKAGFYGLDAADTFVASIKPYADVLGLKGQGSFVGGSAQERIETAVKTMDKVTPKIDDIAQSLKNVQKEADYIDPGSYPAFIFGKKVHEGVGTFRKLADDGAVFIDEARPLIKVFPSLLGEPDEKKYLIIFQNDKELRPSGGFMTAYAIFRLNHGIVHVDRSEDIYSLDNTVPNKPKAPAPILKYLPKVYNLNLRDTNLSPDFPTSMENFRKLYKTAGGYQKVDGIIAVDTQALVAAMNVLGDITTNGQTFTTKTDPRCNCPQVIYELEVYADQPVNYLKGNRKGLIGDLMYEIMNKAFSSSPKLYWGPLIQTMFTQVAQKHIMFSLDNKDAQKGLFAVNGGGKIMDFEGDYFHLNEANFGGDKANLYVDQNVLQEYSIDKDGVVTKTVTINYKNPYKPSDCNLERGGLCLNADFRDWIRLYVPKGSKLKESKGSEVKMTSYDELGKTVFEGFLTVRPLGIGRLTIAYSLPFKLAKDSPLPLLIQKQPGTDNDNYVIKINSKEKANFILDTDKTLKFDL